MGLWRTPYILPPLPHCLRKAAGISEDPVPTSVQSSSRPGNPSSSSSLPPPPPSSPPPPPPPSPPPFLLLSLWPGPARRSSLRLEGPLLSGAPTQAHGSMKREEEEAAQREKSRLLQGREKRYRKQEWNWKKENSLQIQNSSPPLL